MEYRRARVTGGTYFFTVVTHHRRQFRFHRYVQEGKYDVTWGVGSSLQCEEGFE
jgi:REP element-mobilizing transposase RayT